MNPNFLSAARNLAAAYYDLHAWAIGVDGPLAKEQIQEAAHIFKEMLLAYGMQQLIAFERELPSLSTEDLQDVILSELRRTRGSATTDELRFEAGLIVQDIHRPNIF